MPPKLLPASPHLVHLKKQAKDLLDGYKAGNVEVCASIREFHPRLTQATDTEILATDLSLSDAQLVIAREYSFTSWPKLKHFVDTYDTETISDSAQRLKVAIDADDMDEVRGMVQTNPDLLNEHIRRSRSHNYVNYRPLTYACAGGKAEIAKVLIEVGANVHEDGELPVARGSDNIAVLEVLVEHGADLNIKVYDWGPLILYPCEDHRLEQLNWLLTHGADPNKQCQDTRCTWTALQMVLQTYVKTDRMQACLEALIQAGAEYEDGPVFDILRGRRDLLKVRLDKNPGIVHEHFTIGLGGIVYGGFYGGAPLTNTTLLHYCAEFNLLEEAKILFAYGANVNSCAKPDRNSRSDHTPIYHTVATNWNFNYPMLELFLEHRANLSIRSTVQVPSFVEHSGDQADPGGGQIKKRGRHFKDTTPLGYALRYPQPPYGVLPTKEKGYNEPHRRVVELLRKHGAPE